MQELILASGSGRRRLLLSRLGVGYTVIVPDIDETPMQGESSEDYVMRMSQIKASTVAEDLENCTPVLAADTVISLNGKIIGKPADKEHAKSILHMLSGNRHDVFTGINLKSCKAEYHSLTKSQVKFKVLSNAEIEKYCLTEEPCDKAGAYAIQGQAARFIEYVSGSYTNVVGLPLLEVYGLLKQAKIVIQ